MPSKRKGLRLQLGKIRITPRAVDAFFAAHQTPHGFRDRHRAGDWGEISQQEKAQNEQALKEGLYIRSAYSLKTGVIIWIMTNPDRSKTLFLLPEEYRSG